MSYFIFAFYQLFGVDHLNVITNIKPNQLNHYKSNQSGSFLPKLLIIFFADTFFSNLISLLIVKTVKEQKNLCR